MVPLSFATEVSVELTEKVGFESCARLKFPCGSEENASSHSAITQCMPDEKVPTIVNCKLPLPSVHEDIPRFISFLASYMSRNIPLEIAIDGQNFKPCGNLLSPETDMQFYSLPDVKNISPNGGPPDARAICTLSLYSEYVPIENRRSGRSGSKAREHEIEVKIASMLLEDDIIVPAVQQDDDIFELSCRLSTWPKEDMKPFEAHVWLSIRNRNFAPTGLRIHFIRSQPSTL